METILDEKELLVRIKDQMARSHSARLAVAFWGKGAARDSGHCRSNISDRDHLQSLPWRHKSGARFAP